MHSKWGSEKNRSTLKQKMATTITLSAARSKFPKVQLSLSYPLTQNRRGHWATVILLNIEEIFIVGNLKLFCLFLVVEGIVQMHHLRKKLQDNYCTWKSSRKSTCCENDFKLWMWFLQLQDHEQILLEWPHEKAACRSRIKQLCLQQMFCKKTEPVSSSQAYAATCWIVLQCMRKEIQLKEKFEKAPKCARNSAMSTVWKEFQFKKRLKIAQNSS